MNPVTQADLDRLNRNLQGLEYAIRQGRMGSRTIEIAEERLCRQIFLNSSVICLIFSFALLCCIFEPNMINFVVTIGVCSCVWTINLVNQLGFMMILGVNDG